MIYKFKVLSWNISWGAMRGDEKSINDKTVYHLAHNICYIKHPNPSCLENVTNYIGYLSKKFDFIGLQELPDNIYKKKNGYTFEIINNINKLNNNRYSYISTNFDVANVLTFFNKQKYILIYNIQGNLHPGGRPFHILFFKKINSDYYYIIINLHNGHRNHINILEQTISNYIDINIKIIKKFKLIVLGDFNDRGNYNYWLRLQPFKYVSNNLITNKLKNCIVKCTHTPPNTCCVGSIKLRIKLGDDKHYGDYILINNNKEDIIKLSLPSQKLFEYNAKIKPTSDHLPIIGNIIFNE